MSDRGMAECFRNSDGRKRTARRRRQGKNDAPARHSPAPIPGNFGRHLRAPSTIATLKTVVCDTRRESDRILPQFVGSRSFRLTYYLSKVQQAGKVVKGRGNAAAGTLRIR
jgi:hypothetical protein